MTWYPLKGNNSVENFDGIAPGIFFQDDTLQEIENGFVTLKSVKSGSVGYIQYWNNNIDWTIENGLADSQQAAINFEILSGAADPALGNTTNGYADVTRTTSAWYFESTLPQLTGGEFTGLGNYLLYMSTGGPDDRLSESYATDSTATTIEFDVACILDYYTSGNYGLGSASLSGFSQSGVNLSSLPALSGILSHGMLFSDGLYWDYIEVTTEGIRSANHPEIALPLNLLAPKKIRVGFRNQDLYISSSDGRSVVGYGKFDTAVNQEGFSGFVSFGAPSSDGEYAVGTVAQSIDASFGKTYWDNVKILTGDMAIFNSTGVEQLYTTTSTYVIIPPFDPGIDVSQFRYASIGYRPLAGGETIVTAQYFSHENIGDPVDFASVTLTPETSRKEIDLSTFPVFSDPVETVFGQQLVSFTNPISFKISQRSYLGDSLPPPVDFIEVFASTSNFKIDLLPDWKLANSKTVVKFYPDVSAFDSFTTPSEVWTSSLLNVIDQTGLVSTTLTDSSRASDIDVVGTGEVLISGPFGKSFRNFASVTRAAQSGTEAFDYFGGQPVTNFFPNPLFAEGFRPLVSGEPFYYTGQTVGEIASNFSIPDVYTGRSNIEYSSIELYRPEAQARQARINGYLGRTTTPLEEFAQSVHILSGSVYDGTDGIQAQVPSGIATGDLIFTFDLQIEQGESLDLVILGSPQKSFYLPGSYFRDFKTVSFTASNDSYDPVDIKFLVTSGNTAEDYLFNIDNFTVTALETSYLSQTGIEAYVHSTGINADPNPAYQAETIFSTSLYLYSYPETQGTLFNITGEDGRGLDISIDSSGYVTATLDTSLIGYSGAVGGLPVITGALSLAQETLTSNTQVPLGTWTDIGFIHDAHSFVNDINENGTWIIFPVLVEVFNFASTNKATLTIDGHITQTKDLMTGWRSEVDLGYTSTVSTYPHISYIDISGDATSTLVSGLLCEVDNTHFIRPPSSDVESELTIKGARSYPPYFVPDQLYKGNDPDNNLLITGSTADDNLIGSCYNFSSIGYVNWDRGPLRNHLLISGAYDLQNSSPYNDGLTSARFYDGSKAIAKYSSSYERLTNSTGQLGFEEVAPFGEGAIQAFGWIYPRETGEFLSVVQDADAPSNNKISLAVNSSSGLLLTKYDSAGATAFTVTGHDIALSGWNFLKFRFDSPDHLVDTDSTQAIVYLANNSGDSTFVTGSGTDYGFRYQNNSEITFGNGPDINFFNWALPIAHIGDDFTRDGLDTTGSKGGSYQVVVESNLLYTGDIVYPSFNRGEMTLGIGNTGDDYYFGAAMHNSFYGFPSLHGIVAFDNKPFKEVNDYIYRYDSTSVDRACGTNLSPIRVGLTVPEVGINLARYNAPPFNVNSSIASIDLTDRNLNNVVTYRNGEYEVSSSDSITDTALSGYKGINSGLYNGRYDITFSGKVVSSDIEISTLPITDLASETFDKGYYYYLVGRGSRAVKSSNTFVHFTGQLLDTSTGEVVDTYIANLQRVKASISLKDSDGKEINKEAYPYDIFISPYTPDSLLSAVSNGTNIYLDNIGDSASGQLLPDSYFSVLLVTSKNRLPGKSVFVHYDSYDVTSETDELAYKEIVNPQPIFREKQDYESPSVGYFDLSLNEERYYNLTFYGLEATFSGKI